MNLVPVCTGKTARCFSLNRNPRLLGTRFHFLIQFFHNNRAIAEYRSFSQFHCPRLGRIHSTVITAVSHIHHNGQMRLDTCAGPICTAFRRLLPDRRCGIDPRFAPFFFRSFQRFHNNEHSKAVIQCTCRESSIHHGADMGIRHDRCAERNLLKRLLL